MKILAKNFSLENKVKLALRDKNGSNFDDHVLDSQAEEKEAKMNLQLSLNNVKNILSKIGLLMFNLVFVSNPFYYKI